jgi:NADPH:quinone reductase-like Zn-dependent oxidoreductase
VEIPVPSLKKDQVLIKVEAASLNLADSKVQQGLLRPFVPKFPFIPGIDAFVLVQHKLIYFYATNSKTG